MGVKRWERVGIGGEEFGDDGDGDGDGDNGEVIEGVN